MKFNFPYPDGQMAILLAIKELISYPYKFFKSRYADEIDILMDMFMVLERNANNIEMATTLIKLHLEKANFTLDFTDKILRSFIGKAKSKTSYDMAVEMIALGEKTTGKTSIVSRLCKNIFTGKYKETIGLDYQSKRMTIGERNIELLLWEYSDTYTDKRDNFSLLSRIPAIFCGVFDLTNRNSLDTLQFWIDLYHKLPHHTDGFRKSEKNMIGINISDDKEEFAKNHLSDFPLLILGNKSDLEHQRALSQDEIAEFLERNRKKHPNIIYYEVSAKNGENLEKAFNNFLSYIAKSIFGAKQDNNISYQEDGLTHHVNYKNKRLALFKVLKQLARLIDPEVSSDTLQYAKALSFYRLYKTLLYTSQPNMLNAIKSWENSEYKSNISYKALLETHQDFFGTGETDSVKALNEIKDSISNNRIK